MSKISKEEFLNKMVELGKKLIEEDRALNCKHEYKYLGGHNELWVCIHCSEKKR